MKNSMYFSQVIDLEERSGVLKPGQNNATYILRNGVWDFSPFWCLLHR